MTENLSRIKLSGMKNFFTHIISVLLASTALLSCSAEYNEDAMLPPVSNGSHEKTLIINGTVLSLHGDLPLEGIKITLHAAEISSDNQETVSDNIVEYTDNNGVFTLRSEGHVMPISCEITAEDPNGAYMSGKHEIPLIQWDNSYNMQGGIWYVNDCDFHLEAIR